MSGIGALTAAGLYLILLRRTFPVVIGLSFLSYAVNVFLFTTGRLVIDRPPIVGTSGDGYLGEQQGGFKVHGRSEHDPREHSQRFRPPLR